MPPTSVSGASGGAGGTFSGNNESFQEIPEEPVPRHELLLLLLSNRKMVDLFQ